MSDRSRAESSIPSPGVWYEPIEEGSEKVRLQAEPGEAVAAAIEAVGKNRMRQPTDEEKYQLIMGLLGRLSLSHEEAGYPTEVGAKVALGRARNTIQASKKLSQALERAELKFLGSFETNGGTVPAPETVAAKLKRAPRRRRETVPPAEAAELIEAAGLFTRYRQAVADGNEDGRREAETQLLERYDPVIESHVLQIRRSKRANALDKATSTFYRSVLTADLAERDFAITLDRELSLRLGTEPTQGSTK